MSPKSSTARLRLVQPPTHALGGGHIHPTPEQREAALAFLRRQHAGEQQALLETTVTGFDEAQQLYVDEARRQGEGSDVWEATHWIVANAMAREAARRDAP